MKGCLNEINNWSELAQATDYSVHALSRQCQVSVRQLERFFRKRTGQSPHCWLNRLRQERALRLLVGGSLVKEAAFGLGYKSVAHFSREFKRQYGVSPSQRGLIPGPLLPLDNFCRISTTNVVIQQLKAISRSQP